MTLSSTSKGMTLRVDAIVKTYEKNFEREMNKIDPSACLNYVTNHTQDGRVSGAAVMQEKRKYTIKLLIMFTRIINKVGVIKCLGGDRNLGIRISENPSITYS